MEREKAKLKVVKHLLVCIQTIYVCLSSLSSILDRILNTKCAGVFPSRRVFISCNFSCQMFYDRFCLRGFTSEENKKFHFFISCNFSCQMFYDKFCLRGFTSEEKKIFFLNNLFVLLIYPFVI